MLNKTRVITAICMVLVLVPFMLLGGYFIYGLGAILALIGTYELVKMHNRKYNLPKALDLFIPLLSLALVAVIMVADKVLVADGHKYIIFSFLLIIVVLFI